MGGVQKVKENGKDNLKFTRRQKERQQYVRGECQEMRKKIVWKYIFFKKSHKTVSCDGKEKKKS